ncbi:MULTISPECIES: hypothetical protein [unclassified Brenneria]|uniref:hypothetical protein n=1 Tax=unclassified Brenneria TaxID=2634434 RepID=UPI001554A498|nr:hypothetical protein [Brenneria sp. hezel4-2-4]MEE3652495.1 hypothetical protein [Brenneria sp. HEZEL_4_2_4]NPD02451.1 hypothetical protein [Brenneria sp. hezel4-2-4]
MIGKLVKWKYVILSGAIMMSTANAANDPLKIRSIFDIHSAFCAIKTNGVIGMDNRDSAVAGRGFGSSSTNALLFLANGENSITVEIGALGWFSQEKISDEARKTFKPDASCKVSLTAFKGKQSKVLSQMTIGIGKDGIPFAQFVGEAGSTQVEKVMPQKITAPQVEKGHIPDNYFSDNYFPVGMELYQFTQKVYLKGLPEWKWRNAVPFSGKPQQIQALQLAYLDLWQLFAERNNAAIKSYLSESLQAWAITTGESTDNIYSNTNFSADLKDPSFKMIPINWSDYEIKVMNNQRMLRLVNKSDPTFSPISYFTDDESGEKLIGTFSPIFSFIDGRFIPVI